MNRTDVIEFIFKAETADLDNVMQAVQLRRNQLASRLKSTIRTGDSVKFTSVKKRSPYTYTATVTDIRQTRATVRIAGPSFGKYVVGSLVTVPFAMLSKA
jgi:hypothetical protein